MVSPSPRRDPWAWCDDSTIIGGPPCGAPATAKRATSIAASLGRSVRWVYKWVARAATGGPDWGDRSFATPTRVAAGRAARGGRRGAARPARTVQRGTPLRGTEHPMVLGGLGGHPAPLGPHDRSDPRARGADPPAHRPLHAEGDAVPRAARGPGQPSPPARLRRALLPGRPGALTSFSCVLL